MLPLFETTQSILVHAAPNMPPDYWWVTGCVLLILALTAAIDLFTAIVPDILIFLGLVAVIATQGFTVSWESAAHHLRQALAFGAIIWLINSLWYRRFRADALGMGDAKWTILAVTCFGIIPALYAWGVGSVLASIFIGALRLVRIRASRVTFAPFLFIGLCFGLYWARFAHAAVN